MPICYTVYTEHTYGACRVNKVKRLRSHRREVGLQRPCKLFLRNQNHVLTKHEKQYIIQIEHLFASKGEEKWQVVKIRREH